MIEEKFIFTNQNFGSSDEVLEFVAKLFKREGKILNEEQYVEDVHKRETEFSTNLGNGFCIPHAKSETVVETAIAILKNDIKIPWGEDLPVDIFFVMAIAGKDGNMLHLRVLAEIAQNLMDENFVEKIKSSQNSSEIYALISQLNQLGEKR